MASSTPKSGGYDCKFVDAPPDKLVCQICLLVSATPHQVTCCGRVYCQACLDEHKKHSRTCPNCRKEWKKFPDIRGEQEIKSLKVMCSNSENGCGWAGELRSLDDHLATCGYTVLHCPNKCTKEARMFRRDLDSHLKDRCPNRQYQCPYCKVVGRHCDILTTTHLDMCPKVKICCPNRECKVVVARCDLADHQSKCQYEKIPCKYAEIGCKEKLPYRYMQGHEKDDAFHLHPAIETVNKQQKEMKVMADNAIAGRAGPCVFKMPEYHQHKSSKQAWYSPLFYTHPWGYKICVRVDTNGNGEGKNTHVSVYVYLMKGRNDDNLPWPFTEKVTITLLNQLEDENHHTLTISFPADNIASRRVVGGNRGGALGRSKFISHDQLGFNAANNCQYLKNNCLFFQIKAGIIEPMKPWLTCTF